MHVTGNVLKIVVRPVHLRKIPKLAVMYSMAYILYMVHTSGETVWLGQMVRVGGEQPSCSDSAH